VRAPDAALADYARRDRRFGGVKQDVAPNGEVVALPLNA
jgi:hypothetical protein